MAPRDPDPDSDSDGGSEPGEQVRVAFTLAADCADRSLEVPPLPISIPAAIRPRGLSALLNHLLGRRDAVVEEKDGAGGLPTVKFDFILGQSNRLLRTGVEREARRSGLSLEEAVPILYFPAANEPELEGQSEPLPDWISAMAVCGDALLAACYDGSLQALPTRAAAGRLDPTAAAHCGGVHSSAVKCAAAVPADDGAGWVATGSMDHTLVLSRLGPSSVTTRTLEPHAVCAGGHAASLGSVDLLPSLRLASGDWDGGVCVWDGRQAPEPEAEPRARGKRSRTNDSAAVSLAVETVPSIAPQVSIQAHASKVSGISWGNLEKKGTAAVAQLVTGSWDHSIKVWDIESRDCVLTLNGSRVVSCLDTSHHSSGIVATGHPDCTVRLWDVRANDSKQSNLLVANSAFKPSHKEWITSVKWSPVQAYHLASTSNDGTIKFWDIRSSLPLYSVRAFSKDQKGLCLAYDTDGTVYAGGTDCIVKEFKPLLPQIHSNE